MDKEGEDMKTLDEVITGLDICKNFSYCTHPQKGECPYLFEDNTCNQDDLYMDALHYLKAYRDQQMLFSGHQPISYWGGKTRPIIQIDGEYFCVIDYTHKHDGCWRCIKVKPIGDGIFDGWTCCDDDNYLLDRTGKMICREIGWDLREEKI